MLATLAGYLMKIVVMLAIATSSVAVHVGEAAAATRSAKITLNQVTSVVVGSTYTASGRLVNTGSRNNKTIVLQSRSSGTWRTVAVKKRQDDGRYRLQVVARTPGTLTLRAVVKLNRRVLDTSSARRVTIGTGNVPDSVVVDGSLPSGGDPGTSANNFGLALNIQNGDNAPLYLGWYWDQYWDAGRGSWVSEPVTMYAPYGGAGRWYCWHWSGGCWWEQHPWRLP